MSDEEVIEVPRVAEITATSNAAPTPAPTTTTSSGFFSWMTTSTWIILVLVGVILYLLWRQWTTSISPPPPELQPLSSAAANAATATNTANAIPNIVPLTSDDILAQLQHEFNIPALFFANGPSAGRPAAATHIEEIEEEDEDNDDNEHQPQGDVKGKEKV